jgi:sec-independent protein translocase protein TatA
MTVPRGRKSLFLPLAKPNFEDKSKAGRAKAALRCGGMPMGSFSIWHWIIVAVVVMLLFGGRGKISSLMGDFAQGIKAFKKGMAEEPAEAKSEPKAIDQAPSAPMADKSRSGTVS